MSDRPSLEDLKLRGADIPAPEDLRALYRKAFHDYGLRALWSSRPVDEPTIADLLAITESLRVEGGLFGRRLAEQIVTACRATMQEAVNADTALLEQNGLRIEWTLRFPTIHTAIIRSGDEGTLLEWVVDSAFRFFPALQDELFGYVLHPADIATNKVLAAAGRREPRDIADLLGIHERYLPLGAVIWAASAKDPGLSPEGIIADIRRNARYQQADYDRLQNEAPLDAAVMARTLRAALDEADAFVRTMPAGMEGLLFLRGDGQPVQPDPARLEGYTAHGGQQRGHWPSSPGITSAMLERHDRQADP
jgi:hypothetical protein